MREALVFVGRKKEAAVEDRLFDRMPEEIKRLNKLSRRERREQRREKFARENGLK